MHFLAYILIYPGLFLISLLPFRILYLFSDILYFILYHLIGYRRKIVEANLNLVFPNLSDAEKKMIMKKFYRHLSDLVFETIKSISLKEGHLLDRFTIENPEIIIEIEGLDKSCIVLYGHFASYEWSTTIAFYSNYMGYGVYKPLKNNYFDALLKRIRSKFKTKMISFKNVKKRLREHELKGIRTMTGFITDQSPKHPRRQFWAPFMGIKVPCLTGAETLAKELDFSVYFLKIKKTKRGYYSASLIQMAKNPGDFEDFEIIRSFNSLLEDQIRETPEYYLWTHKRWKHRGKKEEN